MKNLLARGGIEFLAVLLGISGSLWVDDYRIELANKEKTIVTLQSLGKELRDAKKYGEIRVQRIENESKALHYIIDNWGDIIPDSLMKIELGNWNLILSLKAYLAFHPPKAIYNSLSNDGSIGLISDAEVKKKINQVFQIRMNHLIEGIENQQYFYRRFNDYIIRNHPLLANPDLTGRQKELEAFLSDQAIYGFLSEQKNMRDFVKGVIGAHLKEIQDLILTIDEYLERE
jgi:hypothetical protein